MRLIKRPLKFLGGFTLIELLTVMTIIAILAGLILAIAGPVNKHAAMARAGAEIQGLSTGCERFKADNGTYPHQALAVSGSISISDPIPSDLLFPAGPNASGNSSPPGSGGSTAYSAASLELYEALTGDLSLSGTGTAGVTNYIADMKQDVWGRPNPSVPVSGTNRVSYLSDPFGNCYGYSTAQATMVASGTMTTSSVAVGYNPTFDLWSTGGSLSAPYNGSGSTAPFSPGDPALQWKTNWTQ